MLLWLLSVCFCSKEHWIYVVCWLILSFIAVELPEAVQAARQTQVNSIPKMELRAGQVSKATRTASESTTSGQGSIYLFYIICCLFSTLTVCRHQHWNLCFLGRLAFQAVA